MTIVLLHGATSSGRVWEPVLPMLSARHRVFTPTLAGHRGGPPLPPAPARVVSRIVDTMCQQLDEAAIDTAHLVGNSLGGGSLSNSRGVAGRDQFWHSHQLERGGRLATFGGC